MSPSYHPSLEAAIARAVVRRHHTGLPFYTYHTYTGLPFYIHYTYTCSTDSTYSTCSTCSTTLALLSRCACTTWAYAWSCATSERSTRGPSRASRAPSPQSATSEPPPPGASLHAQQCSCVISSKAAPPRLTAPPVTPPMACASVRASAPRWMRVGLRPYLMALLSAAVPLGCLTNLQ